MNIADHFRIKPGRTVSLGRFNTEAEVERVAAAEKAQSKRRNGDEFGL